MKKQIYESFNRIAKISKSKIACVDKFSGIFCKSLLYRYMGIPGMRKVFQNGKHARSGSYKKSEQTHRLLRGAWRRWDKRRGLFFKKRKRHPKVECLVCDELDVF